MLHLANSVCVIVLGTHRGGTSAVAGIVHHLGYFIAPKQHLLGSKQANPKGFFEDRRLNKNA